MKKFCFRILAISVLTFWFPINSTAGGPQAGARTYAQNYKDMVLVTCIMDAYKNAKDIAIDAGSSISALRDWTYYDLENSPDAVKSLVDEYLARDYHNPLVEAEIEGVRFDFLKCLDLYHSKELNLLTERMVLNPEHTYRQDNSLQVGAELNSVTGQVSNQPNRR